MNEERQQRQSETLEAGLKFRDKLAVKLSQRVGGVKMKKLAYRRGNSRTTLAHMATAVVNAASIALDGQLFVFGGNNGTNDVATVQAYDTHKNKWRTLSSLAAALINLCIKNAIN